ncbi:MAG: DUF7144 family membrane protein [Motilibacteraceae bacterium]
MSDTRQTGTTTTTTTSTGGLSVTRERAPEPSGWVGWVYFAGIMLVMLGAFQAIMGFTALFKDSYYWVSSDNLLVKVDYTGWGWTHLILGLVAVAAGLGVMAGQMWARVLGIAFAVISAVVNLAFVAAYPFWSLVIIALDVVVIFALAVHGAEAKQID